MIKPMLAKVFEKEEKKKVKYPGYVQPKLDGVRLIWDGTQGLALSRTGKPLAVPQEVLEELRDEYNGMILDGELYSPTMKFDEISGDVRRVVNRKKSAVCYWVFDMINNGLFSSRNLDLNILEANQKRFKRIKILPAEVVYSREEVIEKFNAYLQEGFEGLMFRDANAPYEHKRTHHLLKMKRWFVEDGIITGFIEGKGKHVGRLGALVVYNSMGESKGWKCKVGTGFSDAERIAFWRGRREFIGRKIRVKFQEKTKIGTPRFPVFVGWWKD